MATNLERFTAVCNALVNGTASVAQRTAVGDAFIAEYDDAEIASLIPGATRATLTNEQRAALSMLVWGRFTRHTWLRYRIHAKELEGRAEALAETPPV